MPSATSEGSSKSWSRTRYRYMPSQSQPSGIHYVNSPTPPPVQYLSHTTNRPGLRPLVVPRPFSEFPLSNSVRMIPVASHSIVPGNTTKDLAEYLRTTTPPWYDPSSDPRNKPGSIVHKKSAFGFLRSNTSAPTQPDPNPVFLPDSVIARTSTNGKRYLHIELPAETTMGHRSRPSLQASCTSEDGDRYHRDEPGGSPNRPGGAKTGTTPSTSPVVPQGSGEKQMPSSSPWGTGRPEHSDTDTAESYHSYLRTQTAEGSLLKGGARPPAKPRRPASADAVGRGTKRNPQFRNRSNTVDNPIYPYDQKQRSADRSCNATVVTATPNYKSVFIHSHGLPPRKSSITKTRSFPPSAHISMAHESFLRRNLADRHPTPPQEHYKIKRSSTQSTVAETIRSDGSSSVTTDAESTPSVSNAPSSPFSFNTTARAPPRPGPAPTRALPSLPEGHDTSIANKDRTANLSKHSVTPDKSDAQSVTASPRETEATGTGGHLENASPETLKVSRKSREERVRERKMRDLQSTRARREMRVSENTHHQAAHGNEDRQAEIRNSHTSATTSSSSTSGSRPRTGRRPSASSSLQGSTIGLPKESDPGLNSYSPIMIVAEQEPMTQPTPLEHHPAKKSESIKQLCGSITGSHAHSRSPSPSLPSSDDDSVRKPRIKKKGSLLSSATTAAAFRAFEAGAPSGREAEIEARLVAVEKKNSLLESALLAILQSTAQIPAGVLPGSPQAGPSSAREANPQGPPSLDALVQSLCVSLRQDIKPTSS
ncbi:MAG: hypothetical protein M1839_006905 [Geoglossum umbratile]|nr:MAG: hypothetical protein M1839_006905 [Geoglossum umbratile]